MIRNLTSVAKLGCLVATMGVLAAGCFDDPGTVAGEVSGTNQFRYVCDASRAVENCSGTAVVFPTAIARSSLFRLSIAPQSATDVDELRPISDEVVGTAANGAWVCNTEGLAGLVAFNRAGDVVDYVHVKVETPARLTVERHGASGSGYDASRGSSVTSLSLRVGEKVYLSAVPYGKSATPLAGALPYAWASSVADVVRTTDLGSASEPSAFVAVTGNQPGVTRLRVEGAGLSTDFEVTVR